MKRTFHDFDGKIKTFEWRGPGKSTRWPEKGGRITPTTVWFDPLTKKNIAIPDIAWDVLKIQFVDSDVNQ